MVDESLTPIISIKSTEMATRFLELDKLIGSTQLLPHLKENLLSQIEKVLSAEVYLDRLDEFRKNVEFTVNKVRPFVLTNFRENAKSQKASEQEVLTNLLKTVPLYEFTDTLFLSFRTVGDIKSAARILIERLKTDQIHSSQYLFFDKLLMNELRPVNYWYYINVYNLLLNLHASGVTHLEHYNNSNVKNLLDEWTELLLFHFGKRRELRCLWAFEGVLYRFAKRMLILTKPARDLIETRVDFEQYLLPEEFIAWTGPSEAGVLIQTIENIVLRGLGKVIEKHYERKNRQFAFAIACQEYSELLTFTKKLEEASQSEYADIKKGLGDKWSELLFYDQINNYFDPLGSAVCSLLVEHPDYLAQLEEKEKNRIILMASIRGVNYADAVCKKMGWAYSQVDIPIEKRNEYYNPIIDPYTYSI